MGERRLTTKGIVFFGALTVFLLLLHSADEIARGAAAQQYASVGVGAAALFLILLFVLYVFGVGWAWKEPPRPSHHRMFLGWERKLGYVIVLVLSPFAFGRFLFHAYTLFGSVSLEAIAAAYTSQAVGVFFVFVYLALALTSLMALLLSHYALAVPKQE